MRMRLLCESELAMIPRSDTGDGNQPPSRSAVDPVADRGQKGSTRVPESLSDAIGDVETFIAAARGPACSSCLALRDALQIAQQEFHASEHLRFRYLERAEKAESELSTLLAARERLIAQMKAEIMTRPAGTTADLHNFIKALSTLGSQA